jgi:hypothetical protein
VTRFPLRYAHQNILVGEGDALFRMDSVSYERHAAGDCWRSSSNAMPWSA